MNIYIFGGREGEHGKIYVLEKAKFNISNNLSS